MKKLIVLGIAALTFTSCQQSAKIGFVDNGELVNEYQEKKDVEARLEVKIQAYQKRKDSLTRAFQLEAQDFQLNAEKMSQTKAQEKYQLLGQKQQTLQKQFQDEEAEINKESQALNDSIINKVKRFVANHGKANGYDFIFGKNDIIGNLYHAKEKYDVTKAVLDELNKDYAASKK
jgi:outer membrane protein